MGLENELYQQGGDPIQDGDDEDALGGLVLARVDVQGEDDRIGQEGDAGDGGNEVVLLHEQVQEVAERKKPVLDKIIDQEAQDGRQRAERESQPDVVLFEELEGILFDRHSCHVFSSCCLMV